MPHLTLDDANSFTFNLGERTFQIDGFELSARLQASGVQAKLQAGHELDQETLETLAHCTRDAVQANDEEPVPELDEYRWFAIASRIGVEMDRLGNSPRPQPTTQPSTGTPPASASAD